MAAAGHDSPVVDYEKKVKSKVNVTEPERFMG